MAAMEWTDTADTGVDWTCSALHINTVHIV